MATNKRKDAAALFELLDNSTLKVPKNAGSLKIPAWWSSKTNPTTPSSAADDMTDIAFDNADGIAVAPAPAVTASNPQSRMFEPPPSGEAPEAMPSIRPPAIVATINHENGSSTAAASAASPRPAASASAVVSPPKPPIDPSVPVAPREPKIFAPQMYAQQRRPWVTPRPGAFARLPSSVLLGGCVAAVIVIMGVVLAARHKENTANANSVAATPTGLSTAARLSPTPALGTPSQGRASIAPASTPATPQPARVLEPGQASWQYELYYVVIASTPSKDVAEKNAQFIANNGVSVAVVPDKKGIYHLVSVDGFPSTSAAQTLRTRIVEIGHLTDAFKRTHKAWDDALVQNHISLVR